MNPAACVCVCASLNTLCLTWFVCFVETEQLCCSVDTTSVVFPYHHQNQMTERTVQPICRCDAFVSISVFLPPTVSWKASLPPLHHFLIQTYLLLSRHRLGTFPVGPQRRFHPRLLRRHARHAPQLHLPHPRLAHPRQPHAQVLQRPPGEEGGGDPDPAQVSFLRPAAAEGSQSAPA